MVSLFRFLLIIAFLQRVLFQEVQQGGVMSGFLYLVVLDKLLYELVDSNCGAEVCSTACGNPVLCDDLTVLATLPRLLQLMLDISHGYSLKWHFKFQSVKSCVVLFSKQNARSNSIFMLGDQPLLNEVHATRLGIRHYANLKSKKKKTYWRMLPERPECVLRNARLRCKSNRFKSYDLRQSFPENRNSYYSLWLRDMESLECSIDRSN